ncbi:hypothetical protein [Oleiagrimonas sp.]|jgi:hypothetical protein|uniref:hypothetical protein n=1 Tax=Oleiagrimonas sp. TaxID=2010330 RepID=UPI0026255621|nr:hypothetical protein [Oleiagrimonas sp.]MDA3914760.1 hypothetical protein [Oleiagrimonas sp.]
MTTKRKKTPAPKSKTLALDAEGKSKDRLVADVAASPVAQSALILTTYAKPQLGEVSLSDLMLTLQDSAAKVKAGDMSEAETMLATQATALNAMFSELARRAALNMGEYLGATESYMKLALRAQNQCRTTLETLSTIKHPPVVFAKQANIAHGHQQVNNGAEQDKHIARDAPARTCEKEKTPNKLLEADHGQRLDTGTTGTAGASHPPMETVGAIHRAQDGSGQGSGER